MGLADEVIRRYGQNRQQAWQGDAMMPMPMGSAEGMELLPHRSAIDVRDLEGIAVRHHGLGRQDGLAEGLQRGAENGRAMEQRRRNALLEALAEEVSSRGRATVNTIEAPVSGKDWTKAVIRERAEKEVSLLVAGVAELVARVKAGELDG